MSQHYEEIITDLDLQVRLVDDVYCVVNRESELLLIRKGERPVSVGSVSPGKRTEIEELASGFRPVDAPAFRVGHPHSGDTTTPASRLIEVLEEGGLLQRRVFWQGSPLYTFAPLERPPSHQQASSVTHSGQVILSRFAATVREGRGLFLRSPLAWAELEVEHSAVMALIGALGRPLDAVEASERVPQLPGELSFLILQDLMRAGVAVPAHDSSGSAELRHRQWGLHDLGLHHGSRSTPRTLRSGLGRTEWARHLGAVSGPARRTPHSGRTVPLYRPSIEELRDRDVSLTSVLEDRRSIRRHDDDRPVTSQQVGELLFRCGRVVESFVSEHGQERVRKPYPSGGAAGELEMYPVVRLAAGLDPGIYHYDPFEHHLTHIRRCDAHVAKFLNDARNAMAQERAPQLLILITARFDRILQTYEGMGYTLILKHVGVLQQTMSLVATAMGLASCCVGSGPATTFNEITGVDYLEESSVGEFALGSRLPEGRSEGSEGQ